MNDKEKKEICDKCDISYVCDYKSMPDCKYLNEKEIKSKDDCEWFGIKTIQKPCGQCSKNCRYNNKTQKDCQKEIEELLQKSFNENDIEFSFNGVVIGNKGYLKMVDDLVRQAIIPYFSEVLDNAGYGKIEDYKKEIVTLLQDNNSLYENERLHLLEIKKLKEDREKCVNALSDKYSFKTTQDNVLRVFDIVREQAIKEFSEKLRDKLGYCDEDYDMHYSFYQSDLDEILKKYGVLDLKTNKE